MNAGMGEVSNDDGVDVAAGVPFESLFTLPFALHLRPLPHISYLAEQDSGQSSEQEDNSDDHHSNASSQSSNYRAGTHRLAPQTDTVPPHSLRTISMLLENTGCLDAISSWSELLEMIDAADSDPHFTNLRAFFDARFDNNGRLIERDPPGSNSLKRNTSRRASTKSKGETSKSNASGNGLASMMRRRQSSRQYEDDASVANGERDKIRAPEVIVLSKDGTESRRVQFKVRLDLHSVGLSPKPPRPPVITRSSARSPTVKSVRKQNSHVRAATDGSDIQRVRSNTSSDHSHSDHLSLHPVASPDSFRSRALSDGSDEVSLSGRRPSDAMSTSPISAVRARGKKNSRTSTMSSAAALSLAASDFGTSPDSADGVSRNGNRSGLFRKGSSKRTESTRRPSMIKRLMDFKGMRNVRSKDSMRSASQEILGDEKSGHVPIARTTSPEYNGMPASINLQRVHSNAEASDISNEDALDVGDDEGSVVSSANARMGPMGVPTNKRRASSGGVGSSALMGFRPAATMHPVQEGAVFSGASSDEMDHSMGRSEARLDEEEDDNFDREHDFLGFLRKAANTSLALRRVSHRPVQSPSRTPRGSRTASSGLNTPSGSIELEERASVEAMLAPFKLADPTWWLSGSVDPLPVSIACALSQALGWNGLMDLCYGKASRSARAGAYQPLGRAAEMDKKLQDEKTRVENWAQGVAGGTSQSGIVNEHTSQGHEEIEARKKLASLKLSTEAGSDAVAPSESASALKDDGNEGAIRSTKAENAAKISNWIRKKSVISGLVGAAPTENETGEKNKENTQSMFSNPLPFGKQDDLRTWQDWAEVTRSIADWLQEYETTRVRNGLSGELGHDAQSDTYLQNVDSGFVESTVAHESFATSMSKVRYASHASYQVPHCVVKDALNKQHGFRRRHGIPEGLPIGPDGQEVGDYRWARKRLSPNHFATSSTLAASSLSYCMQQLATADWTHQSAWELDYLEMCVFKSPVVAHRFPSPGSAIVPSSQTYQPAPDDEEARNRAMPCPYPTVEGAWSSTEWLHWLQHISNGKIIVPAVSWQAWWTLIAVLNGGDGSDRALDVQLKAEEESFTVLDDLEAVFI